MKLLKTFVILVLIVAIFGGAMFALNLYTGPIIAKNSAGAANDRLNSVMAGGAAYEDITATLSDLPATVTAVHKETSGLGYVIEATATSDYTGGAPMDILIGVDSTGVICGIQLVSHSESLIFGADYPSTYIGKDSALAGVELYAGSTFSSTAFKDSVSAALNALAANNLIAAGVKGDDQILTEMIPTVAPGFTKLLEETASGNIQKAFQAENGAGFAYIMTAGEKSYLAVVNAMGACKVYDTEGNDVTADNAALADEAKTDAAAKQAAYLDPFKSKIEKMMEGAADITPITLDTFNSVVSAASFTFEGATYYAFYSRSVGFHQMDIYFIIDANGAITKMDAKQFIFEEEYFMAFGGMDVTAYKDGFVGITGDTFTGEEVIIATATMTSNAVKQATEDTFDAFNALKGGAQ
ncbi:MAG: FMN-binding protein [Oscillospiraceae bacterium]|nr:FMN-binding protein [Oscillospiraceae bacterium]